MIEKIIEKYKSHKKQGFLNLPESYKEKYAFAGVGGHSISNLYPVLMYLGVPIKMIYSRNSSNAVKMANRFPGASGTGNFDDICKNNDITGVFICLNSDQHFNFVKKALESGKNVFVDKPPCKSKSELEELVELEKKHKVQCVTGLQRRYSKTYGLLSKKVLKAISYNYRFYTGAYPEGNVIYDLFIHPLDIVIHLFGKVKELKSNIQKNNKGINVSLLLKHEKGCSGVIDISTLYSWRKIEESMIVVAPSGVFHCEYPFVLKETGKTGQILGIPLEKVIPSKFSGQKIYFDNNGLNPVSEHNSLVDQGFSGELSSFIKICEGEKTTNKSSLNSLIPVYDLIEKLQM